MKGNQYIFILLLMAGMFTSCRKEKIDHENDFNKSYQSWLSFKASSNNSYHYKTTFSSWTGYSTQTVITVQAGKVVRRSYIAQHFNHPTNDTTVHEQWTEEADSLNTHQNGAATISLDEIYQKAKTVWLVKRGDATTYFETKNNGMISTCGYVPEGCQDDCFTGINIELIEKL